VVALSELGVGCCGHASAAHAERNISAILLRARSLAPGVGIAQNSIFVVRERRWRMPRRKPHTPDAVDKMSQPSLRGSYPRGYGESV
jgi:hypothetical protein